MLSYVTMKVKSEIARDAIHTEHFLPPESRIDRRHPEALILDDPKYPLSWLD